jgi:hypothetical protein
MKSLICVIHTVYDALEKVWAGPRGHRLASSMLVVFFLFSLALVEMNRFNLFPAWITTIIPKNHLAAIQATMTLLLIIEVMGLIFSLVESVSTSVGRQLEILSLILLRNVFKEISHFSEPLVWAHFSDKLGYLAATSISAVFIFGVLSVFYHVKKEDALSEFEEDKKQFILAKKGVAIGLLVFFHLIVLKHFVWFFVGGTDIDPFESLYTLLIISDVLILFISMRYGHDYPIAFRNSGFAVVTVFIRVSLIASPYYSALIGSGAAVFALATLYIYSVFIRKHT